ncbi:MAG: hypothetical protein ABJA10_06450 [Aestuariivirga sp.]
MFFAHVARVVAILLFVFSVLSVLMALSIAFDLAEPLNAAWARFFPSLPTTGAAIDTAIYRFGIAIALGVMAEISFSLRELLYRP